MGGELTGEIVNEACRRISNCAPHIAFLDSTFLSKVAPLEGSGTKYRRKFWTIMIGADAGSQIGTTKKVVVAPHYVSGHWCGATADLDNGQLVYYDLFLQRPAPDRGARRTRCLRRSSFR